MFMEGCMRGCMRSCLGGYVRVGVLPATESTRGEDAGPFDEVNAATVGGTSDDNNGWRAAAAEGAPVWVGSVMT